MFKKRGQGQSWSLDIILAFVIFVLIIGIFYALLSHNKGDKTQDLTLESSTVTSNLEQSNAQASNLTVIDNGKIEKTKLETLYKSDYESLKKQLGIRGEFCIYVVDQFGNIVTTEDGKGSFGNGNYTVNDKPCGSVLS
jgi:Tfp pilus assembly protein PilO